MTIRQQKSSDKIWKDEAGMQIPYNRTTPFERESEKTIAVITKEAMAIQNKLIYFKGYIEEKAQKLYDLFLKEHDGKHQGSKGKGNVVFYNFDRSIKVEVSVNEQITFDDNTINLAKEKLDEFLTKHTGGVDLVIKELIMGAFETSRGRLDSKKVMSLKRHEHRIKDKLFSEAVRLIDKSIRRPESKRYFRVWVKDDAGEYQNIDLNFSSISTHQ